MGLTKAARIGSRGAPYSNAAFDLLLLGWL